MRRYQALPRSRNRLLGANHAGGGGSSVSAVVVLSPRRLRPGIDDSRPPLLTESNDSNVFFYLAISP